MAQGTQAAISASRSEERLVPGSGSAADGFSPAGLKVLVVDDDPMCLKVVSAMLKRCSYQGTLAGMRGFMFLFVCVRERERARGGIE